MGELLRDRRASVLLAGRYPGLVEGMRVLLATRFTGIFIVADEAALLHGAERVRPALVVMDLSLGSANVLARIAEIRACVPEVRLLVVSVHDDATIAQAAIDAGADGVVLKRALATDLLAAVDALQEGGRYISRGVRATSESGLAATGARA
jgi:DNA-binding NarL/FixJ family response regulator